MKIFVVDDDPIDRMFICNALRQREKNLVLLECENGRDAVKRSATAEPVYALVDIRMPGMDGFQTCAAIRQTIPGRDCYIHMLTTSKEKEDHDMALDRGADAVHVKPDTQVEYRRLADLILAQWERGTTH